MFINPKSDEWIHAEVYPFIDKKEDAAWADKITVHSNGLITWQRTQCTKEQFIEYIANISDAMGVAFKMSDQVKGEQQ